MSQPTTGDDVLADAALRLFLGEQGLVRRPDDMRVTELTGGVSSVTHAVHHDDGSLVVKQTLGRLRVEQEWRAPRRRSANEALGLRLAAAVSPDAVPHVLAFDATRNLLVVDHAPDGWRTWKEEVMAGCLRPEIARRLGEVLGQLHGIPVDATDELDPGQELFDALRVEPYHRAVAAARPALAEPVDELVTELRAPQAFVHGDFSPKNVLVGPGPDLWIIDFEVAHRGNAVFDPAFMSSHLVLKRLHFGAADGRWAELLAAFHTSLDASSPLEIDWDRVAAHTGLLLVARVLGRSPVDYLDERGRRRAVALGETLIGASEPYAGLTKAMEGLPG